MAKHSGKGYSSGNNAGNGAKAVSAAMANRSPSKPHRVVPAPSKAGTMGPGSRCGGVGMKKC